MTKQQQEAYNKFLKALELQEQGISRQEIFKQVGYASLDSLTKYMRKQGYKYNEQQQKYIKIDSNTDCNTKSNTKSNTDCNTGVIIVEKQEPQISNEQVALLDMLQNEQETIKNLLEWYKRHCNTSNTFIKIELPKAENVMISTRSNKIVWEQFKAFAKRNSSDFKMGDLLAQALKEFIDKYEGENI